jgi:hypothetical protein
MPTGTVVRNGKLFVARLLLRMMAPDDRPRC